jgi:lipopolysaccharide/colanic/teichoic acid biosynthesis glycosyltransferase
MLRIDNLTDSRNRTTAHGHVIRYRRRVALRGPRSTSSPSRSEVPRPHARISSDEQLVIVEVVDERSLSSLNSVYARRVKPALDRTVAAGLLVVTSPVLATLAVSVKLTLGSPVFYCQTRVGKDGGDFTVYKFRTMKTDRRSRSVAAGASYPGPERRRTHKTMADPRHTRFGRWLRALSLDELPQLVNVVRGEMSLVGPRPEVSEVADLTGLRHHPRHHLHPGITGMWQVSPARGQFIVEGLDLDIRYLEACSFRTDMTILMQTFTALRRRTGS